MKVLKRNLYDFQATELLIPIRSKHQYLISLLKSSRILLLNNLEEGLSHFNLYLVIDKMRRIFIETPTKIVSFSFPLHIESIDNEITKMYTSLEQDIDNMAISSTLSILQSDSFTSNPSFLNIGSEENNENAIGINILNELLLREPAYVRFDHDETLQNGNLHPLDHIDVNYSSYGTFKIGCDDLYTYSKIQDFLNTRTNCKYLT